MSKILTLDRDHLAAMVSDAMFYACHAVFYDLLDVGLSAAAQYKQSLQNACRCGDWEKIRYVVKEVVARIQNTPDAQAPVKRYLETRKGYALKTVSIFYRESADIGPKLFHF